MSIKVKTKTTSEDWAAAIDSIEQTVSREHIDDLSARTLDYVINVIHGKNAVISYSAGKDSIVLEHLLRPLRLKSFLAVCNLEYPSFVAWTQNNAPERCEIINSGIGYEYLTAHPDMLFPDNSAKAAKWYDIVQHKVQNQYIKQNKVDYLILGRRKADGNHCGDCGQYRKGDCIFFSPLYEWTHEDILAYLHYNECELPPIYDYPDGYRQGTHPWAAFILYGRDKKYALDRLWNIDKNIIINAAEHLPEIRSYYENRKNEVK